MVRPEQIPFFQQLYQVAGAAVEVQKFQEQQQG
jgi:hypothetical protein